MYYNFILNLTLQAISTSTIDLSASVLCNPHSYTIILLSKTLFAILAIIRYAYLVNEYSV